MKITRPEHDAASDLFRRLATRDPGLTAQAQARGVWIVRGTPAHELMLDLAALNDVATAWAIADHCPPASFARFQRIAEREAGPPMTETERKAGRLALLASERAARQARRHAQAERAARRASGSA